VPRDAAAELAEERARTWLAWKAHHDHVEGILDHPCGVCWRTLRSCTCDAELRAATEGGTHGDHP
jgi:hypothetical protein